jgi:hypothetical protein
MDHHETNRSLNSSITPFISNQLNHSLQLCGAAVQVGCSGLDAAVAGQQVTGSHRPIADLGVFPFSAN